MEVVGIEPGNSMQVIFSEIERSFASILGIGQASFGLRRVLAYQLQSNYVPISFGSACALAGCLQWMFVLVGDRATAIDT